MLIRKVNINDAAVICEIYAPYVTNTAVTFEYEVPSISEMQHRINEVTTEYPWYVAEIDGRVVGYAYSTKLKSRPAFSHSVETSIYLSNDFKGKGIGRCLYETLENDLKSWGIINLYACIAYSDIQDEYLSHDSIKFHEAMGYTQVGLFKKCGKKFNRWYDVVWMERIIGLHIIPELQEYIVNDILPRYDKFDSAHRREHAEMVIKQSIELAEKFCVNLDMAYTIAAFHDLGLINGREYHHVDSARIVHEDRNLPMWFSNDEINIIAEAVEDHRASSKNPPRSIYGRIVAEADRYIYTEDILRRTIQFGIDHYPELTREEHYRRMKEHLIEKYGRNGYLKLWFPESPNRARLEQLQDIIEDEEQMKRFFNILFPQLYYLKK